MPFHYFTQGGCTVHGFRVTSNGEVKEFTGTLRNHYTDLARASAAARRKYRDSTITITSTRDAKTRYRVAIDKLLEISEKCD